MVRKETTEFPITSGKKNLLIDDWLPDFALAKLCESIADLGGIIFCFKIQRCI